VGVNELTEKKTSESGEGRRRKKKKKKKKKRREWCVAGDDEGP
jgi:hypothetical protein